MGWNIQGLKDICFSFFFLIFFYDKGLLLLSETKKREKNSLICFDRAPFFQTALKMMMIFLFGFLAR